MFEMESERPKYARVARTALLLASLIAATPLRALAEEEPSAHLSGALEDGEHAPANHLIWAARACYIEATFRESDCVALLWVARKRAERSQREWLAMLSDYSAVHADNPRAKEVRAFPWGDVAGKTTRFNRNWKRLRELVIEVASGQHADPCPRAQHWGGSMDDPHGRMVPARCSIVTANTFYAVRAWRHR
jgi:hypothetical protein